MHKQSGFTLIELSIVLVIIGLIIGGILVGRDLISAAEVRAQIAQIEKYNTAVNTFKNKYGGIPGDLNLNLVTQFGFAQGPGCNGQQGGRDGNGILDGYYSPNVLVQLMGETALFWVDLSTVNLIDGEFPNNGANAVGCVPASVLNTSLSPGTTYIGDYLPQGKIGHGTFVYVYESGAYNWFGLSAVTGSSLYTLISGTGIPVIQAYNMDKKVDDGLPLSGSVVAVYLGGVQALPANNAPNNPTDTTATCYNTTGVGSYSISASANGGSGSNCAISFRFQ